jgi:integral membrane sensor domain MASE1
MVFAVIFVLLWLQLSIEFGCCSNMKITDGLFFAVLAFLPALFWPVWLLLIVLQAIWNKVRGGPSMNTWKRSPEDGSSNKFRMY